MVTWGGWDVSGVVFLTCCECTVPTVPPGVINVTHGLCPFCAADRDSTLPDRFCRRCGKGHASSVERCECGCVLEVGAVVGLSF